MIRLNDVSVIFSHGKEKKCVFDALSLDIPSQSTVAVMGSSGSGKTTLLRLIAGLISPTSGNVTRETDSVSYLFQDTALLPWLTALENVNLVLSDSEKTKSVAKDWLSRVGLSGEEERYPYELSGGMRQRVALARALCTNADLLLLDEPFRGLDEVLHQRMRDLIYAERKGKITLLVTHDKQDLCIADYCLTVAPDAIRLQSLCTE